jgi:hypothetical protein
VPDVAELAARIQNCNGLIAPVCFGTNFWLSLSLKVPVVFWSSEVQHELLSAYGLHRASGIALCPKFSWFAEYNIKPVIDFPEPLNRAPSISL